jgi:hypothetical protein
MKAFKWCEPFLNGRSFEPLRLTVNQNHQTITPSNNSAATHHQLVNIQQKAHDLFMSFSMKTYSFSPHYLLTVFSLMIFPFSSTNILALLFPFFN